MVTQEQARAEKVLLQDKLIKQHGSDAFGGFGLTKFGEDWAVVINVLKTGLVVPSSSNGVTVVANRTSPTRAF